MTLNIKSYGTWYLCSDVPHRNTFGWHSAIMTSGDFMVDDKDIEKLVQRMKDIQVEQAKVIRRLQVVQNKCTMSNTSKFSLDDRVILRAE